jgi:uncharacterized hydrophobic protein (TIGR00271 family)
MNSTYIRFHLKKLKDYLAVKTVMVNHQGIIREVSSGVDRSWIYYLMLLMAGLIALLGLLTNSVAVVIGAMLISPLMGPIISSGLALTIGDLALARRAFRTIAISVGLTILLTAFVTLLSPLKEPTSEILARMRPNIYDLFIAMLSGIVGAVALCTKRNYLITATGVAVATAVIPPLSVAGYGLGTGQIMLGLGGFLLFFTNFVAIVLTSDLVFFIMGFRTSHVETIQYSQRKRLLVIGGLLALISIPLVYTLVVDLQKVKTKKRIERVLKKHLNKEEHSRMTGYLFKQIKERMDVRVTVNTVQYLAKPTEQAMESELKESLGKTVDLHLEQVLVASEALPEQQDTTGFAEGTGILREETAAEISAKAGSLAAKAEQQLAAALHPFPVTGLMLGFSTGQQPLHVTAILQRDWPVSNDELLLLSRQLERVLEQPLTLQLNMAPLLPLISFTDDGAISSECVAVMDRIRQLPGTLDNYRYQIELTGRRNRSQIKALEKHLIETLQVPSKAITIQHRRTTKTLPELALRILRHQ